MTIGVAFFSWDSKMGPILDVKYPDSFEISNALINKIYMTHAYEEKGGGLKKELIEINYSNKIILSYCDKTRVPTVGYEILTLIVHEKEKFNLYKLKLKLLDFTKELFQRNKEERNEYFLENVNIFFEKIVPPKKILLLGRASTGKTSIKKLIFEGASPKDLLYNPLEPTRGIAPSVYSWLDLQLGVFDTSGQELNLLLKNEKKQAIAFEKSDIIIYLFDFPLWMAISQEILDDIQTILNIIRDKSYNTTLLLFLHKIDLINQNIRESSIRDIKNQVRNQFNLSIFFTSIYPDLIYSTYNAFYNIMSGFSDDTAYFKITLDTMLKDFSKTMCFITNLNDSIIIQTMTKDFNTNLINQAHKLIALLTQSFKDISNETIEHLIISGSNNLNIILKNLNISNFNLNNLICISETLSAEKLVRLTREIQVELFNFYYIHKKTVIENE